MEEIGIGLVNQQAAEVKTIDYPEWVGYPGWTVGEKVGQDDKGYDEYEVFNQDKRYIVPSNRLLLIKAFVERYKND